jgi:hypothetical protein
VVVSFHGGLAEVGDDLVDHGARVLDDLAGAGRISPVAPMAARICWRAFLARAAIWRLFSAERSASSCQLCWLAEQVGHAGLAGQLLVLLRQTADLVIGGHERIEAGRQHLAGGQHAFQRLGDAAQLLGGMLTVCRISPLAAWLAGSSACPSRSWMPTKRAVRLSMADWSAPGPAGHCPATPAALRAEVGQRVGRVAREVQAKPGPPTGRATAGTRKGSAEASAPARTPVGIAQQRLPSTAPQDVARLVPAGIVVIVVATADQEADQQTQPPVLGQHHEQQQIDQAQHWQDIAKRFQSHDPDLLFQLGSMRVAPRMRTMRQRLRQVLAILGNRQQTHTALGCRSAANLALIPTGLVYPARTNPQPIVLVAWRRLSSNKGQFPFEL